MEAIKIKATNVADFRRQLVDEIIRQTGMEIHAITTQMRADRHDHDREWDNDCERCQLEREQCANDY